MYVYLLAFYYLWRYQLPQTKRQKLASNSLVPRLIACLGVRLTWAMHGRHVRLRRWCRCRYSTGVQVHDRHVILARVGNGRGLHFSAFSFLLVLLHFQGYRM